ncbi:MAG: PilZ domain-containing protein [Candidatus Omnitrophica bacterium]|nr:PilZ domain-containing protein [Candidatus Omnitrophota bacterium]
MEKRENILTVQEVSALLKISASSLYDLARQGKIRAVKFGRHWRFLAKDIEAHLQGKEEASPDKALSERRKFPRLQTEITASLESDLVRLGGGTSRGMIQDISENGVHFVCEPDMELEAGQPVTLCFDLQEPDAVQMKIKGRVVRTVQNGHRSVGIKLRHLSEVDQEVIRRYVD